LHTLIGCVSVSVSVSEHEESEVSKMNTASKHATITKNSSLRVIGSGEHTLLTGPGEHPPAYRADKPRPLLDRYEVELASLSGGLL
jgi:hypothetical protein